MAYLVPLRGKRTKKLRVHLSDDGVTSYCKRVTQLSDDFIVRNRLKGGVERYSICSFCNKIKKVMLTDEQKEFLLNLKKNSSMTYKEMCKQLNIPLYTIIKFLKGNGIKNTKVKERDEAIAKKYNGSNAAQLAVEHGIMVDLVHNIVGRYKKIGKNVKATSKEEDKPKNKEKSKKINYVFKSSFHFCNNDECNNDCERCKKIRYLNSN